MLKNPVELKKDNGVVGDRKTEKEIWGLQAMKSLPLYGLRNQIQVCVMGVYIFMSWWTPILG